MKRHRVSNRLQGYDYTLPGAYFVTLVAKERQLLFGELHGEEVRLTSFGKIVSREWKRTAQLRPEVSLDEFVVMPDHLHAILFLNDRSQIQPSLGAHCGAPLRLPKLHRQPKSLGSIIAGFKSKASQSAGQSLWQRNYYDHIIRDERELNQIREYILHNPLLLSQVFDAQ